MTSLSCLHGRLLNGTARTVGCGLMLAMTIVLSGCGGSSSGGSSSSIAASGLGNSSSSSLSVSSSSSSVAAIVGIETPSAISVVTATNAN